MRKSQAILAAVALAATIGATTWVLAAASDNLKKAPAAVQATVKSLVGDNKLGAFDEETADGKKLYDLEFSIKGTDYAADISPTGEILTREVDIDLVMVPPAVMEAAKKAHADGKIGESSIITEGDQMCYGIDSKVGKETHEMEISAGGKVLKDSIEAPEAPAAPGAAEKKD